MTDYIERALAFVKKHLDAADAFDGSKNHTIYVSKASQYLEAQILHEKEAGNPLEAQHLALLREFVEQFKDKDERKYPADWKIKWAWSTELRDWFKDHPYDNCDGHAPASPTIGPAPQINKHR